MLSNKFPDLIISTERFVNAYLTSNRLLEVIEAAELFLSESYRVLYSEKSYR